MFKSKSTCINSRIHIYQHTHPRQKFFLLISSPVGVNVSTNFSSSSPCIEFRYSWIVRRSLATSCDVPCAVTTVDGAGPVSVEELHRGPTPAAAGRCLLAAAGAGAGGRVEGEDGKTNAWQKQEATIRATAASSACRDCPPMAADIAC